MRTTLNIPDDLAREARQTALAEGTTLTRLIVEGVQQRIRKAGGISGDYVPDALLAAAALRHDAGLVTADKGLEKCQGVRLRLLA